ncbi:MAG: GcrA family cell cycle regulator [Pseudomonadota bacterium]
MEAALPHPEQTFEPARRGHGPSQSRQALAAGWTDDRVDRLKALWKEGLSATEIAKDLGGTTRSAILGKVHRQGLDARANPAVPGQNKPPPAKRTSSVPKPLRKVLRPLRPPNGEAFKPLLGSTPRPWTSRTSKECRWPIDPPTPGDEMQACCQPLHDHRYCRKHARWSLGPGTRAERDAA